MLRTAFMGSPDFAVPSLRAVAETTDLRLVVSQPDRPAGRGRKLRAPAVKTAALELGVPVLQPRKVRDGALLAGLAEHQLDMLLVTAYGRILPVDILELPVHGAINVHASVLPRWRGAAPIQRAILAGDTETGVSIMQMDQGCDTGKVFRIERTRIRALETAGELSERLALLGGRVLAEFLRAFPDVAPAEAQDESAATHAAKLEKAEGEVDWTRSTRALMDHVRGMDPWPGAYTRRKGAVLKLFGAAPSTCEVSGPAGAVVGVDEAGMHVRTADGCLCVAQLQSPGRKRMAARAAASGDPFGPLEQLGVP